MSSISLEEVLVLGIVVSSIIVFITGVAISNQYKNQ